MADLGTTYTPDNAYMDKLNKAREIAGTDNPEAIKRVLADQAMAGDTQLQGAVQGQQQNVTALQQLGELDKQLAGGVTAANQAQQASSAALNQGLVAKEATYNPNAPASFIAAGPQTTSTQAVEQSINPNTLISPFVASGISSGQASANVGEYGLAKQLRGSRERILGSEVESMTNLWKYTLEQKAKEEQAKKEAAETQFLRDYKYAETMGGVVKDPTTGKEYKFLSPQEKARQEADLKTKTGVLGKTSISGKTFLDEVTDDKGNFVDILRQNPSLTREEIVELAQANVNKYGQFRESKEELDKIGLGFLAEIPGLTASGATSTGKFVPTQDDWNTYNEAMRSGGADLFKNATTQDAKLQLARDIKAQGGVDAYRKSQRLTTPITDLLTPAEKKDLEGQQDLLIELDRGLGKLESFGDRPGGTGWLSGNMPGFMNQFRSPAGRDVIGQIESIRAAYQKAISGATVSDREVARLSQFLPTPQKTENQNIEDIKRLKTGIQINSELFELAKRESLTPGQAYEKYGKQVFEKYGENFEGGGATPAPAPMPAGQPMAVGKYKVTVK